MMKRSKQMLDRLLFRLNPKRPRQTPITVPRRDRNSAPRFRFGLVIIAKNEADYIEEWLEFHLMQGAEHIVVYDNGSTDDTVARLSPYLAEGLVTLVPWSTFQERVNNQSLAYAHALVNFGGWFEWLGFLDADEFLFATVEASMPAILQELSQLPAIGVPWSMFGTDGQLTRPNAPVVASYASKAVMGRGTTPEHAMNVKSIVRPEMVTAVQGAYMETGEWLAKSHKSGLCEMPAGRLQLNHYYTRSAAEFERKLAKGSVRGTAYFDRGRYEQVRDWIDREVIEDRSIMKHLPELQSRLAKRRNTAIG